MKAKKILVAILAASMLSPTLTSCDVGELFQNIGDKIADVGGDVIDTIKDWGSNAWDNTVEWGSNAWNTVSTWGQSTWSQVVDWGTNTGEAVAEWGQTVIDGTKNFFCSVGDFVVDIANSAVTFGLKKGVDKLDLTKGLEEEGSGDDWKEYLDDYEAITYALVSTQFKKVYDVFPAKLEIPSSNQEVYGYAFTDYESAYTYHAGQDDEENYYATGFISLVDEFTIPTADVKKGIEIYKTETDDSSNHYFYSYDCEPFDTHCVVKGQYLKYGVNKEHQIYYENSTYDGNTDTSLGGLYSFDEKKYLYGEDNGFVPKKGNIVDEAFDFDTWKDETKTSFLSGFTIAFSDLKNIISDSISKVKQVISNINDQTILGYNINDVKKSINATSEDDVAVISDEKVALHSVDNEVPSTLSNTAKWIVGLCTGVVVIADIAVAMFFPKVTPLNMTLNSVMSAVSGAAIELTIETIMNDKGFKDVNWVKIGIAAVAGGLAGLIPGNSSKVKCVVTTSLITATTNMAYNFLDGSSFFDSALSFVSSFAIAIVLSTTMTALFNGIGKLISKVAPKLTKKVSTFISNHQIILGGKSMESSTISTINITSKQASDSVEATSVDDRKTVFNTKKAVKHLPGAKNKYFAIVDENGNVISKSQLLKNNGNGYLALKDVEGGNKYASLFVDKNGNPLTRIPIKNGYVQFQNLNATIVNIGSGRSLVASRRENFKMFDDCLKQMLINNPSSVPTDVLNYFSNLGIDYDNLTYTDFETMRTLLNKTWHEGENRATGILVDTTIHHAISHMGGYSLAKALAAMSFPSQIIFTVSQTVVTGA